jgi:SpoVK/Ycf46/Vps4 family AAA+-type ATPase
MLRPGRLGKLLYVPLPTDDDRISILQALTKKVSIQWRSELSPEGVDLVSVAKDPRAAGFSGADLSALVREAGLAVVREMVNQAKDRAVSHSGAAMVTSEDIIGRPYVSSTDLKALAASETAVAVLPASQGAITATGTQSEASELRSILARHFEAAFGKVRASVSTKDRKR